MNNFTKKIKLIVLDLDGTVLNKSINITPRTAKVLEAVHAKGCTIAVSTGRAKPIVPMNIENLPFIDYIITSNGSCIRRKKDETVLYHKFIDRDVALQVFFIARDKGAAFNVFFEDRVFFEIKCVSYMLSGLKIIRWKGLIGLGKMSKNNRYVFSVQRILNKRSGIEKMGCSFNSYDASETALHALQSHVPVNAVRASGNELEITASGVSKGKSLEILSNLLNIDKNNIVAFGDSGNDLPMKKYAGTFVAMGNAAPDVKNAADCITGTVDENGVAQWLEQYLRIQKNL